VGPSRTAGRQVSLLNVIDRSPRPAGLLRAAHSLLRPA
jgi:hypothetical protein